MIGKEFELLASKLDVISKLLALSIINNKPINQQIDVLLKAGLKTSVIADIVGKTENQVSVTKTRLKKKKYQENKEEEI